MLGNCVLPRELEVMLDRAAGSHRHPTVLTAPGSHEVIRSVRPRLLVHRHPTVLTAPGSHEVNTVQPAEAVGSPSPDGVNGARVARSHTVRPPALHDSPLPIGVNGGDATPDLLRDGHGRRHQSVLTVRPTPGGRAGTE